MRGAAQAARPVLKQNWLTVDDISNLFRLTDFRVIRSGRRSCARCRFRFLALLRTASSYAVGNPQFGAGEFRGRSPAPAERGDDRPLSVSVVVPARNEAGNMPRCSRGRRRWERNRADIRRGAFVGRHLRRDRARDRSESASSGDAAASDRPRQRRCGAAGFARHVATC